MNETLCKIRVALLGFGKGHKWRTIGYSGGVSQCMVCIRCGENGWKL